MLINGFILPPFICEKEPGTDDDCVFCSGLMQKLAHDPGSAPATLAEAEAIRADAGIPAGPAGSEDLIRGETKRYGWGPELVLRGFAPLWAALTPGMCATASGNPADALGTPFSRFVTERIGHRTWVGRYDATDRVWLIDPEGPDDGSYHGQWATKADLQRFVENGNSHTVASMAREDEVTITQVKGEDWTATTATSLAAAPDPSSPKVAAIAAGTVVRSIAEATGADNGSWRLTETGGKVGWFRYKSAAGVTGQFAPLVPGGDPAVDQALSDYIARKPSGGATPAQVDAAVLAGRQAQYDADLAAANADPVNIGPRP